MTWVFCLGDLRGHGNPRKRSRWWEQTSPFIVLWCCRYPGISERMCHTYSSPTAHDGSPSWYKVSSWHGKTYQERLIPFQPERPTGREAWAVTATSALGSGTSCSTSSPCAPSQQPDSSQKPEWKHRLFPLQKICSILAPQSCLSPSVTHPYLLQASNASGFSCAHSQSDSSHALSNGRPSTPSSDHPDLICPLGPQALLLCLPLYWLHVFPFYFPSLHYPCRTVFFPHHFLAV